MDVSADFQNFPQTEPQTAKEIKARKAKDEAMAKRDKKLMEERQFQAADKLVAATKEKDAEDQRAAEFDERIKVIRKIRSYVKAFPDSLKEFGLTSSKEAKMSLEELKIHLIDIEYHLGKRGGAELLASGFKEGLRNLDMVNLAFGNPFNLNLKNIDKVADAQMKPKFDPLFTELVCKYENLFSVSVEARLVVAVVELVMTVNRVNKMDDALRKPMNRKTPEDLSNRINKI